MNEKAHDKLSRLSAFHHINGKLHEDRLSCSRRALNPKEPTGFIHPGLVFRVLKKPLASIVGVGNL
jgi:hypothetical protein